MSAISLKQKKPISPASRWRRINIAIKTKVKTPKKFTLTTAWKAGRNNIGQIASRRKSKLKNKHKNIQKIIKIPKNTIFFTKQQTTQYIKNKILVVCETNKGGSFILPKTNTMHVGRIILTNNLFKSNTKNLIGIPIPISNIPFLIKFCCLTLNKFQNYKYATSSGTSAVKLRASKKEKNLKIKMPSGLIKHITTNAMAIIGQVEQLWLHRKTIGKAGILKNLGKKQVVRGIAMNCVDHPHGGKANSCKPEKSPWGWVTKKSH